MEPFRLNNKTIYKVISLEQMAISPRQIDRLKGIYNMFNHVP